MSSTDALIFSLKDVRCRISVLTDFAARFFWLQVDRQPSVCACPPAFFSNPILYQN